MSILLRPQIEPARAAGLTLVTAVAAARSLREATGLDIGIKWPNDLYVDHRKISGILTEASTSAKGLDAVIVGLGLNVNTEAAEVPEDLKMIMTSLKMEAGQTFDRMNLVLALRDAIVNACDLYCTRGLEAFLPGLRELDVTVGRRVAIQKDGQNVLGTAQAIGPQGQLLVHVNADETIEVLAGEVRFI
jgi:BirA family biotin operon repressor/biotin-[acetyl-CoA-carboxylase] ligase